MAKTTLSRRLASSLARPNANASDHVRQALQVLLGMSQYQSLSRDDKKDLRCAVHHLWLALREIESLVKATRTHLLREEP